MQFQKWRQTYLLDNTNANVCFRLENVSLEAPRQQETKLLKHMKNAGIFV